MEGFVIPREKKKTDTYRSVFCIAPKLHAKAIPHSLYWEQAYFITQGLRAGLSVRLNCSAIQADVQEHSLSVMTCLKEELPLPHLFKKHVNKQTYKIGSKGPRSAVNSTKAGQPPRDQLFGHNGNLHTRAHLHLDLPGATKPKSPALTKVMQLPRTISPHPTALGPALVRVPQV